MSILEQVQADVRTALRGRQRDRAGALRMVANSLQQAAKEGNEDEISVLRRERKRRLEAARAYRDAGREDRAEVEEREATLIDGYLPTQLSQEELERLVDDAIAELGAIGPGDLGKVMGAVMPRVGGRADGRRVSEAVRARLADTGEA
jgi:uncharacterized protein YqeY